MDHMECDVWQKSMIVTIAICSWSAGANHRRGGMDDEQQQSFKYVGNT